MQSPFWKRNRSYSYSHQDHMWAGPAGLLW